MKSSQYLNMSRLFFRQKGAFPVYLLFFVTSRCTCQCGHCFYWQHTNKREKELTLDEIEKISQSMDHLLQVTLTGGDAALRKDLSEIARIFAVNNHVANFSIGTNGSHPEKIERHLSAMLPWLKETGANMTIDLSMDGLGEDHDAVRALPGLFDKVVESASLVKEYKKQYAGINLCADMTVSGLNQHKLRPLYEFIRDKIQPDIANALLIRGNPRDPKSKDVNLQKYVEVAQWIEEDVMNGKFKGYSFAPDILHVKDIILRKLIIKTARENRYQAPCSAGTLTGVIYPEGDVAGCELKDDRLGNLRDADYDMKKVWKSQAANAIRKNIKDTRCFCIHQCFLSNNVLFNPRFLPSFTYNYARLRAKKKK